MTHPNIKAFLSTIARSEGTKDLGDDGYNVLVGSRPSQVLTFSSYHDHPGIVLRVRNDDPRTAFDEEILSSAAGRYQILKKIFVAYREQLKLPDFGPESQDKIAIQLIKECDALEDVLSGSVETAVRKCRSRWASFPGAGYGQHENSFASLRLAFVDYGGLLS
jgi:muramidase (phage lysozyme)